MENGQISAQITKLADLLEFQGANSFKIRAYRRGARVIKDSTESFSTMAQSDPSVLLEIDGIGKGVAEKITQLIQDGEIAEINDILETVPPTVLDILRIPGLGPKKAAALYQELGILTSNAELGEGVSAVFNELSSALPAEEYGPLLVAPHNLRQRFTQLIRIEAENAKNGKPSGIRAKMNQLQDPQIIHELYQASQAGVPILLNVRGLCCLKPRIPNLSPTIRVYSTLGRFLEHGRIFRFENAGDPLFFIGSADWMRRNLDKRMETITPFFDEVVKQELEEILNI